MASFAKQVFLYIVAAGIVAESARREQAVQVLEDSGGGFPAKLVGVSAEDLWNEYGNDLYPYLEADLLLLKRIRRADPELFAEKFKDASVGRYVETTKAQKAGQSAVQGMIAVAGTVIPVTETFEGLRQARTLAQWIAESYTWKQWLSRGKGHVLEKGQDASLQYISDATMGNLWEAMLNVDAVQIVPKGGHSIPVFERKAREYLDYTLPENTVLTPIAKTPTVKGGEASVFVAWEDRGELMSAWIHEEHAIPSLFAANTAIDLFEFPSQDAPVVGRLKAGDLFAVSRNVLDKQDTWWMKLADGRGYVLKDTLGYTGVRRSPKDEPEGSAAMKAGWAVDQSTSFRCARLAYNIGMFAAGFWTGGATWLIAAGTNSLHIGGRAFLEHSAMTDVDLKLEFLVMQLRTWELFRVHYGRSCHVSKKPCRAEGHKCIREIAFFDGDLGLEPGYGKCMPHALPSREDGEACLVHADCDSGNCEPAPGCKGRACLDATCKPFPDS